MGEAGQLGALRFAERVLQLLDDGRYTATYKFAVLIGLLAEKVIELYWPHTVPFAGHRGAEVLRQNKGGQAEILTLVTRFRARYAPEATTPRWEARLHALDAYTRLVRAVEWKLIKMPLPRLQVMGTVHVPVIYEIGWDASIRQGEVAEYQRGEGGTFSNASRSCRALASTCCN